MSEYSLPSNKKFGIFFSGIFFILSVYFYFNGNELLVYLLSLFVVFLLIITFVKADILMPFNKLWMRFGLLLGKIISPIILGVIFFTLFSPLGILFRLIGRDHLSLKLKKKFSYWVKHEITTRNEPFKNQF